MAAPAERPAPPEHRIAYPNVIVGAALDGEREYAADAVVVGTGAGGATAAACATRGSTCSCSRRGRSTRPRASSPIPPP